MRHLKLIFVWGVVLALLSGAVSMLFPKQYSAVSQVLIISRDRSGVDPYTQARAAERVGQNLASVMQTTDFYNKVMETSVQFDRAPWQNLSARDTRKQWQKNVKAAMLYNTSLLQITVYSKTAADAVAFSGAVTQTVVGRGWEYIGGDVAIKAVSDPLASRFPARPNLIVNTAVGFAVGLLLSAAWVAKYRRHHLFRE